LDWSDEVIIANTGLPLVVIDTGNSPVAKLDRKPARAHEPSQFALVRRSASNAEIAALRR
jgi:hypothetical protein